MIEKSNILNNNNAPLVSVDIISYNNVHYLNKSVMSVLSQSYDNIELVISDDASVECNIEILSLEICKAAMKLLALKKGKGFANNDIKDKWKHFSDDSLEIDNIFISEFELWKKNNYGNYYNCALKLVKSNFSQIKSLKILRNKINKGTVKHLKTLKKNASGKYIMFLAADDMLHDNYVIKDMIYHFEELPEDALVLTSQCGMYDINLKKLLYYAVNEDLKQIITTSTPQQLFAELTDWCIIPAAGTIYKKDVFDIYGDLDDRYHLIEDWTYFLKLTRSGAKIYFYDRLTYMHRDGGISHGNTTGGNLAYRYYLEDWLLLTKTEILPYINTIPDNNKKRCLKRYKDACIEYTRQIKFPKMTIERKILFYAYNIDRYFPKVCKLILEYNKEKSKDILKFSFFLVICSCLISSVPEKNCNSLFLYYGFGVTGILLYIISSVLLISYYILKATRKIKQHFI